MNKGIDYCDLCKKSGKSDTSKMKLITAEETGESYREGAGIITKQRYKNFKEVEVGICRDCFLTQMKLKFKNNFLFLFFFTLFFILLFIVLLIVKADRDFLMLIGVVSIFSAILSAIFGFIIKKGIDNIKNNKIHNVSYYSNTWFIPLFKKTALLKIRSEYDPDLKGIIWGARKIGDFLPAEWEYIMCWTNDEWNTLEGETQKQRKNPNENNP